MPCIIYKRLQESQTVSVFSYKYVSYKYVEVLGLKLLLLAVEDEGILKKVNPKMYFRK